MEKIYAGIDIGGTTIKLAFLNDSGVILHKWIVTTDKTNHGSHIPKQISVSLLQNLRKYKIKNEYLLGIGVGAPGFIDLTRGHVHEAINIGWRDFPLKSLLEQQTGKPVVVDNDANLAAIGEMWKGSGEGAKELLCVTLGTGVGGGIISNGQIIHGVAGMAGEIGHITSIPHGGALCNCGKTGCLETIASATGISRLAHERIGQFPGSILNMIAPKKPRLTAKNVFDACLKKDPLALEIIDYLCFYLGLALANLANSLNPEKIVIGGGVSRAKQLLLQPLNHHFQRYALPRVMNSVELSIAKLGNDAGVVGGAYRCLSPPEFCR